MTDPERFSQRSTGLAAELLRASAAEQPNARGMQQTLMALGLSGVVLSTTSVAGATAVGAAPVASAVSAGAATGSAGLTAAGSIKTVSAALVVKWIGLGVLGGVGLAGVAAVASPTPSAVVSPAPTHAPVVSRALPTPTRPEAPTAVVASAAPTVVPPATPLAPRAFAAEPHSTNTELYRGTPLASEVAYVDRARALLAANQWSQGLALLEGYEQAFHEARLLPEVLFLQLDAYERSGRESEARRAAQRLATGYPTSPHAGRARKLLGQ